jgi:DNA-binding CsgD family transcriptional regulator
MGNIFWHDVVAKKAKKFFEWGADPHYTQLYMETYARINPIFPAAHSFPVGRVFCQAEVISLNELRETRIYREWMQPQGYIDFIGCHLEKSAASVVLTTVIRHERDGVVDEASLARMQLIVPHIRRAAVISNVVSSGTCEAATLTDTLDGLAAGIFLVDETGRIIHANTSGKAMLDQSLILHDVGGRLAANDHEAHHALRDVFSSAHAGDMAVGVKGMAVAMEAPGGERYVAHVLPLTAGARRHASTDYAAAAAVFVHKAALNIPSASDALAKAYKLTAMELRVLLGIVHVGGGPTVAQDLGISEATVRTHLKHVFAKTGTNRQAELANLVAAFESPLADPGQDRTAD